MKDVLDCDGMPLKPEEMNSVEVLLMFREKL